MLLRGVKRVFCEFDHQDLLHMIKFILAQDCYKGSMHGISSIELREVPHSSYPLR